jgi:hypothetical protein
MHNTVLQRDIRSRLSLSRHSLNRFHANCMSRSVLIRRARRLGRRGPRRRRSKRLLLLLPVVLVVLVVAHQLRHGGVGVRLLHVCLALQTSWPYRFASANA